MNEQNGTKLTWAEIANLQIIEGAPLSEESIAMFDMFEREGWSEEQKADYIREKHVTMAPLAAE